MYGVTRYAKCNTFQVNNEHSRYRLIDFRFQHMIKIMITMQTGIVQVGIKGDGGITHATT